MPPEKCPAHASCVAKLAPAKTRFLNGRLIDRSIRPQFPKGALNDVQIVVTTLAYDGENEVDIVGLIGASAALQISDIPFEGPIAGVKIGMLDGDLIVNPTHEEIEEGDLELVVSARAEGICMIEAGANIVGEEQMAEAHELAMRLIQPVLDLQDELQKKVGKPKVEMIISKVPDKVIAAIESKYGVEFKAAVGTQVKAERGEALNALKDKVKAELAEELGDDMSHLSAAWEQLSSKCTRAMILEEGKRPDGRAIGDLRELTAKVDILPRTHGTGLFSRGETQVLTIATLGSPRRRENHRRSGRRREAALSAPLQLPALFGRRNPSASRPRSPRNRAWRAGRKSPRARPARAERFSLYVALRFGSFEFKRFDFDGERLRFDFGFDGRGRADYGASRGHFDWSD